MWKSALKKPTDVGDYYLSYHHIIVVVFVTFQMDCYKGVTGTIYEYGALTLNGEEYIQFKQYAGKHVLFINVATYWGLTAQYPGKNSCCNSWKKLCLMTIL